MVWMNNGSGSFTDSGLDLKDGSIYESYGVDLGDLDGDGDVRSPNCRRPLDQRAF